MRDFTSFPRLEWFISRSFSYSHPRVSPSHRRVCLQVPLDGIVVHGSALVSIQHITGEALPVLKRVGDEVPAGAVNSDGALVVESIRSSEDSTPARIARLTEAAQNRRPAVSRLLDSVGDRYSKAILAVTALTMVCGPLVFGWPFLGGAARRTARLPFCPRRRPARFSWPRWCTWPPSERAPDAASWFAAASPSTPSPSAARWRWTRRGPSRAGG